MQKIHIFIKRRSDVATTSLLSEFLRREINMEQLNEIITKIDDFVWGPVMPSLLREYWE